MECYFDIFDIDEKSKFLIETLFCFLLFSDDKVVRDIEAIFKIDLPQIMHDSMYAISGYYEE